MESRWKSVKGNEKQLKSIKNIQSRWKMFKVDEKQIESMKSWWKINDC